MIDLEEEEEEIEVMKSVTMDFWEGLKLPYQMRLMVTLPERRGPPWYSKGKESRSRAWSMKARFLAAATATVAEME